jgi:hypothetical protein
VNEQVKKQTKKRKKKNKGSSSGRIQEMWPQPQVLLFIQTSQIPSHVMGPWKLYRSKRGEKY